MAHASGESYDFQQDGADLRFTADANGKVVGRGRGQYADGTLRLTLSAGGPNGNLTANCNLKPTLGATHWVGMGPGNGASFAAQMFR